MEEENNFISPYKVREFIENFYQNKDPNIIDTKKKIHPLVHFRYNSFNVAVGPQGCGKTTFLITELIILSSVTDVYKGIVYVSSNGLYSTFKDFIQYIKIPIDTIDYTEFRKSFNNYINQRTPEEHIFVIFEDASFLFEHEDKDMFNFFVKLRHYRATFWMNIHIWKSLNSSLKTQISSVYIFKGFNRKNLRYIFSQLATSIDPRLLEASYYNMNNYQCLWICNENGKANVI